MSAPTDSRRSIPRRWAALFLVCAAGAFPADSRAADGPYYSVSPSVRWDDNITNAPSGDGVRPAVTTELAGRADWIESLGFSTLLTGGLAASADASDPFPGLGRVTAEPSLEIEWKWGLGPFAPVAWAGLDGGETLYDDSERSNLWGAVRAGLRRRLTESVRVGAVASAGDADARQRVFGGGYREGRLSLDWDPTEEWRVSLFGGGRGGAVTTEVRAYWYDEYLVPADDSLEYLYKTEPWASVRTFGAPTIAYRLNATTWTWGAGVAPALGGNSSLSLQVLESRTRGDSVRYADTAVVAGWVHRF